MVSGSGTPASLKCARQPRGMGVAASSGTPVDSAISDVHDLGTHRTTP
jgi:hypothetical protein